MVETEKTLSTVFRRHPSQGRDPAMAHALQHDQTALIPELPTTGAADLVV
jgi:hypothetical protein